MKKWLVGLQIKQKWSYTIRCFLMCVDTVQWQKYDIGLLTRSSFKTFILALNKWNDRLGFWDLPKASWFQKNTIPCVLSTESLLPVV